VASWTQPAHIERSARLLTLRSSVRRVLLGWAGLLLSAYLAFAPGAAGPTVIDVPYRNQLDGSAYALSNCGPTALSMVLAYYGVDASPWELRVRSMRVQHSWVDDEGGYADSYGVFVYNLATVAQSYGVRTEGLWTYAGSRPDELRQWSADDLRREIDWGRPVVVQVKYRALPAHTRPFHCRAGCGGPGFRLRRPMGFDATAEAIRIGEVDLFQAMDRAVTPRVAFAVAMRG
jgi:Peptidase_C39 like family